MQPDSTGASRSRAPALAVGAALLVASFAGFALLRPRQRLEDGVEALTVAVERARALAQSSGGSVRLEYRLSGGGATPGYRVLEARGDAPWSPLPDELALQALQLGAQTRRKGEHSVLVDPQGSVQPFSLVLLQHEGDWDQRTTLHFDATGALTRESWRRRRDAPAETTAPAEE
ncbi:MAG: hypothetical protein NTV21_06650 [Planctomycetota bacterium]|nr:hypothetical protein [Planctomycetota bacterium]